MTAISPVSDDNSRDTLRTRIEAAERRNAERTLADQARAAAGAAVDYTRAHPLTMIGGALLLGLAIGALTRPGRRVMGRVASGAASTVSGAAGAMGEAATGAASSVRRAAVVPASRLGQMLGDWAVTYGVRMIEEAIDAARTGQDRIEALGEEADTRARRIKRDATSAVARAAGTTRTLAATTKHKAVRAMHDLRNS